MAWTNMSAKVVGNMVDEDDWNAIVGNFDAMQAHGTFTPTLTATTTNPTLSDDASHTAEAEYWIVGDGTNGGMVAVWLTFIFGTSGVNAGSGQYLVGNFPADLYRGDTAEFATSVIGGGYLQDAGTARYPTMPYMYSATKAGLLVGTAATLVAHNVPFAWTNSDQIKLWFTYPVGVVP